jgi:lysophospholipase L1-like esterase
MKKAILFGDSIRISYFPLVARQLETEFELWAPEENGGTSRHTLAMLPDWLTDRTADLIHINCGLHDIAIDPPGQSNRVELAEYEENLRGIFTLLQQTEARILWATTTPVLSERHRAKKGFDRREEDVLRYNAAALAIAQSFGLEVDDLHAVVEKGGVEDCLSADGVHMSDLGNHLLADAVASCLRKQG